MSIPTVVENYLRQHHIVAKEMYHVPACTAHQLAETEHVPDEMVTKVVFLFCDDQLLMAILPVDRHLSLNLVKKHLNPEHFRLATEREIEEHVGSMVLGAIPPFGSIFGRPIIVDEALLGQEIIEVPAGFQTESLKLQLDDFIRAEAPQAASFQASDPASFARRRTDGRRLSMMTWMHG
jgi:Ala-tRNA(Pro) deacylase